jgi:hypothetical protein
VRPLERRLEQAATPTRRAPGTLLRGPNWGSHPWVLFAYAALASGQASHQTALSRYDEEPQGALRRRALPLADLLFLTVSAWFTAVTERDRDFRAWVQYE